MNEYQQYLLAFDTGKAMTIVDLKSALGVKKDPDYLVEGVMVWLINNNLLSRTETGSGHGNRAYRLTASGHGYIASGLCPVKALIRSRQW
tara:strand:+ start:1134 stop:1403 length:270 start_codon:yes stop_codon:yes gene_type:complete